MSKSRQGGESTRRKARILSSIAATTIALSCGTNYGFSAWAPQFANRLQLTATQTNLIGNAGNIGMYAMGIPGGILIDTRGPRWGVALGCVFLAMGYFGLKTAYDRGPGSMSVPLLCLFALFSGSGSCTAFSAAIKASASNWPSHRGTATAFPLSAFGLSAFFYTTLATFAFPGDTSGYLKLLAYGTTAMTFVGMLFLQIVNVTRDTDHITAYGVVPEDEPEPSYKRRDSNRMHRTSSKSARGSKHNRGGSKNSMFSNEDETEPLSSSNSSEPGDIQEERQEHRFPSQNETPEITGWALAKSPKFWQLFILLALLCGVGLMTINNIGNDARSLWKHYDDSASKEFITKRQLMHVSILSFCSFLGRLASGIGSDWLIHHHASRFWTLVASATIFVAAQVIALTLEDPTHLFWLSGFTGLAYGTLFGVYPALVADAFGATGLGINWGAITWAPVVSGNAFNLVYGSTLDSHSVFEGDSAGKTGEMICRDGKECYATAYWITLVSSAVGVVWCLWCIRQEKLVSLRGQKEKARRYQP
ncbi:Putative major facilitator superfamily, MFS transporter superfamily [Septoria linicola]|uniref:Major facilitator superfamily, MFS transporter superfamily n=1 Tax=Septoria linicola TaxID=215465 RepID=A0A9Q9ANI0_9PEZI|nr:putative major facilitator superfamily, MFS transporter superfamily [Septoria linicola]USW50213.1 Putative major facilitator superfamily, MFS transporter superfamily [Septoria linicola]